MNVTVETQHVYLPRHADESIVNRAQKVFSRMASRISHLTVTLKDVNGPRGGQVKVCVLKAQLIDGGQVLVVDRSAKLRNAVSSCFKRSKLLISKELKRRNRHRPRIRQFVPAPASGQPEPA